MAVIATAGHVDHGKSALIRALTGIEPDRFAEEQRRGLTLDLGFAHFITPDGTVLDFVDVPGHEDLLRTMIAGAAHASLALLVVDAVEGPRAQTLEHLRVLESAAVPAGVVALTRCDLVDDRRIAEAAIEVANLVDGSVIAWGSPIPTSAITGLGMPELIDALAQRVRSGDARAVGRRDRPVRMVIDRAFHVSGAGTVVTGTLDSGRIQRGQPLSIAGHQVTVRGLQRHGGEQEMIESTARCAVNLSGIDVDRLSRGDVLAEAGRWQFTEVIDGRLHVSDGGTVPKRIEVHLGAARRQAWLRPISTEAGVFRIRFAPELPLRPGDRLVARSIGSGRAIGAVDVLDVCPAERTSKARPDGTVEQVLAGHGWVPIDRAQRIAGQPVDAVVPGWVAAPRVVEATLNDLRARIESGSVSTAALTEPERLLLPRIEGAVVERGEVRIGGHDPVLDHEVVERVRSGGVTPESIDGVDRSVVARLLRLGVFVSHDRVVFHVDALRELKPVLDELWGASPQGFSVSELRTRLGITRKHAVPLVECLDSLGITRRVGDRRLPGRP